MNRLRYILYLIILVALQACTDVADLFSDADDGIQAGDQVAFSARVPQVASRMTKAEYDELVGRFERVQDDYIFDVSMYEQGDADTDVKIASATYNPTKNTVDDVTTYDAYGTLTEATDVMLWPSNVKKYAFHAVSTNSTDHIESDQTSGVKLFAQDLIEGYGYVPGWDAAANEGDGAPIRNLDGLNYLTTKEWYAANKAWGSPMDMTTAELVEHWKKIPLFMRHKRSRITVRLKAGEGIEREQIAYDPDHYHYNNIAENIITEIYSYNDGGTQHVIRPLLGSYDCHYASPDPAPEETVPTACYDAIVNPHDYADGSNMTEQKILAVNLSGMKFSFYAANDREFSSEIDAENGDVKARYNLTEGKHLILDVTLSTDTRKILITAYVVDWEDWPFSSICDDFGQASDPMPINNKAELIEFLTNPEKNKPGNVGVIMPLNFDLTADGGWDPADYELKATLKLAGASITTDQRLFDKISASGSIVNGSVVIADRGGNAPIECAIARENYGMVERINVLRGETTRRATRAGLVTTNYGTIYACASQLPVYNSGGTAEVLIGGIAAEMRYPMKEEEGGVLVPDLSTLPTISQCNVNARIDGGTNVCGGGIAGKAEGKISNNTYEYGITLLQNVNRFKNILYAKGAQDLDIYDNEWCTKVGNSVLNGTTLNNARPEADCYNQVIDSQEELSALISNGTYNNSTSRFRIADSFTVNGDTWTHGVQNLALSASGNLLCELNCNNKTITLTGTTNAKMLFSNIHSHLYDLTLVLAKPIEALPIADAATDEEKLPARAPLAYAAVGNGALISGVKVKSATDAYVKSTASGGLLVWAYDGAIIEDCQSDVDVRIALPEGTGDQQTYFVGGIVCSAAKATLQRCTYRLSALNNTEEAMAANGNVYYGGIVGGTNTKGINAPSLNISDCTSWLTWEVTAERPHAAWGGIIGYSKYQNASSALVTSTDGNCQGNWWAAPAGASATGLASGQNEEKTIGKKNSVTPDYATNY